MVEKGNLIKKTRLNDDSIIEYYENVQIRKSIDDTSIVQYIQTTTGRVIFNYTIQKTLNLIV
jgi:DNA-directed RNA polymerase subunit beta'